jgi:hypothetical protein
MLPAQALTKATVTRNVSLPLGRRQCRFEKRLATTGGMGSRREPVQHRVKRCYIEKYQSAQAPIIVTVTRNVSPPLGGRQCRFEKRLATVGGMGSHREPV